MRILNDRKAHDDSTEGLHSGATGCGILTSILKKRSRSEAQQSARDIP
jgi:hypothetical protein